MKLATVLGVMLSCAAAFGEPPPPPEVQTARDQALKQFHDSQEGTRLAQAVKDATDAKARASSTEDKIAASKVLLSAKKAMADAERAVLLLDPGIQAASLEAQRLAQVEAARRMEASAKARQQFEAENAKRADLTKQLREAQDKLLLAMTKEVGDVDVTLLSAGVQEVPLKEGGRSTKGEHPQFLVKVFIKNRSETKKIDYEPWAGRGFRINGGVATLTDDLGNTYSRIDYGISLNVVGAVERTSSIYPGKYQSDVIIFEKPVAKAKTLYLELPSKNLEGEGILKFTFSANGFDTR